MATSAEVAIVPPFNSSLDNAVYLGSLVEIMFGMRFMQPVEWYSGHRFFKYFDQPIHK